MSRLISSGALEPLADRTFRDIWLAGLASHFGSFIQAVAAAWMMTRLAPSSQLVALVQAAAFGPLLFAPLAGAVADMVDRRRLILGALMVMILGSSILAVLAQTGRITPSLLLLMLVVTGTGGAFYAPAWLASVPELVPRRMVPAAISLSSISYNFARTAAPALGGVVVLYAGPATAFAINTVTFMLLALALLRWRSTRTVTPQAERRRWSSLAGAILDGVRYAMSVAPMRATLLRAGTFGLGSAALWALLPLVARDLLGGDALIYGWLLGALGLGAVLAGLANASLRHHLSPRALAMLSNVLFAAGSLVVGFGGPTPSALLALVAAGAGWVLGLTNYNIAIQTGAPRAVAARAVALYLTATLGANALGAVLWGAWASAWGVDHALWASGICLVLCFAIQDRAMIYAEHEAAAPADD